MLRRTMNTMETMILVTVTLASGIWMLTHDGIINGIPFLICTLALVWNHVKGLVEEDTKEDQKEQA